MIHITSRGLRWPDLYTTNPGPRNAPSASVCGNGGIRWAAQEQQGIPKNYGFVLVLVRFLACVPARDYQAEMWELDMSGREGAGGRTVLRAVGIPRIAEMLCFIRF